MITDRIGLGNFFAGVMVARRNHHFSNWWYIEIIQLGLHSLQGSGAKYPFFVLDFDKKFLITVSENQTFLTAVYFSKCMF